MPHVREYKRGAAMQYAKKWAYGRNPAYYDFTGIGGDCTNFISQCLYAGSGVMNYAPDGWYYRNVNDRAPAWTGVEFLKTFLVNNKTRGPFATETTAANMEIGDVIQLGDGDRFYHSLLVTGIENGRLFVSAHTFNTYMRPIDSYSFSKIRFLHIEGVYV